MDQIKRLRVKTVVTVVLTEEMRQKLAVHLNNYFYNRAARVYRDCIDDFSEDPEKAYYWVQEQAWGEIPNVHEILEIDADWSFVDDQELDYMNATEWSQILGFPVVCPTFEEAKDMYENEYLTEEGEI